MKQFPEVDLNHPQITVVPDIPSLMQAEFTKVSNVILYRRPELKGDFNALARVLVEHYEPTYYAERFMNKSLMIDGHRQELRDICQGHGEAVEQAAETICNDVESLVAAAKTRKNPEIFLRISDVRPSWRIRMADRYLKDVPTIQKFALLGSDYRWHFDGASNQRMGRLLTPYTDPTTEGVYDSYARFGHDFDADIKPFAKPFRFRVGDIWRHALKGENIRPFIHREPVPYGPRLLLVVDF